MVVSIWQVLFSVKVIWLFKGIDIFIQNDMLKMQYKILKNLWKYFEMNFIYIILK